MDKSGYLLIVFVYELSNDGSFNNCSYYESINGFLPKGNPKYLETLKHINKIGEYVASNFLRQNKQYKRSDIKTELLIIKNSDYQDLPRCISDIRRNCMSIMDFFKESGIY